MMRRDRAGCAVLNSGSFQVRGLVTGVLTLGLVMLLASPAFAVPQFTPTASSLLHTTTNGPGVTYFTPGGVGAQVEFNDVTGNLIVDAKIDVVNYFDSGNGACLTDTVGSNCSHNFTTNLDFHVDAIFKDLSALSVGSGFTQIDVNYETTGGTDFSWTDPTDGNSTMLSGSWVAGTYNATAYTGLSASFLYNDGSVFGTAGVFGSVQVIGFAEVDATPFAGLFGGANTDFMLNLSQLFNFNPSIDSMAAALALGGSLTSFTGESQGEIFRVVDNEFEVNPIPEPGTALLLATGLAGLATRRRAGRLH